MAKIKVLYFMGEGRSGGTILAKLLDQADNIFSAGEVRKFWQTWLDEGHRCSCNVHPSECEVWSAVYQHAFGEYNDIDLQAMYNIAQSRLRNYQFPRFLFAPLRNLYKPQFEDYIENTQKIYQALQAVTGADVILDSTRFLAHGGVLGHWLEDLEVYILHLVRDPRAVAYAWTIKRHAQSKLYPPVWTALRWNLWNLGSHLVARDKTFSYMRIYYEELTKNPQEIVTNILEFVGKSDTELPFITANEVKVVAPYHILAGNRSRFGQTETLKIQSDSQWQKSLNSWQKLIVTLVSLPLLIWYGYLPNRYKYR